MIPSLDSWFHDVVSAMAYSIAEKHAEPLSHNFKPPYNDLTQFALQQHSRIATYLRAPLLAATVGFDLWAIMGNGNFFHRLPPAARLRQMEAWKDSKFGFKRDFIRYFESLALLQLYDRHNFPTKEINFKVENFFHQVVTHPPSESRHEIIVVGSGPGGAITACLLAEAGRKVLLVEEGEYFSLESCAPFSKDEMVQKYRNGGQTVALGKNKVAYVEGRCVGGGSEINSGLYHRTPPDILEGWRREFGVDGIREEDMRPHFESCEKDVSVSYLPGIAPAASRKLHDGAAGLGWKSFEVPRWFHFDPHAKNINGGKRQSMTETFIPRFLKSGGQLLPQTRVGQIHQDNGKWKVSATHPTAGSIHLTTESLFICAGAVQTPALLRRSGITHNIGNSLRLHPTVKVVAKFPDQVNSEHMGVPVHQVKEFAPRFSFGCSISTPPYLALALLDHRGETRELARTWSHLATYYSMIVGEGRGTVRSLPKIRDPFVKYNLTHADRRDLAEGLRKLCLALFESGATALYPAIQRSAYFLTREDLGKLPNILPSGLLNLMTIHLFSSCPMGEFKEKCATNSYGEVHGFKNLYVNDASLLCTAPGVNPQGSIMALARRNVLKFLRRHPR